MRNLALCRLQTDSLLPSPAFVSLSPRCRATAREDQAPDLRDTRVPSMIQAPVFLTFLNSHPRP